MLRTMSRIKRVCAMILVPRLFRGSGCSPGKFYRLRNEASPVLSRGFCKTDWTKPKYVTKPYSDVRTEEPTETATLPIEDRRALEKSFSLKIIVLRTLLQNSDRIKTGVIKEKYQRLLLYIFGWPRLEGKTDKSAKLNTTTAKQREEEKLTQKIEEITEVPLVEAEPRPDVQNPPNTTGPTVMTFVNSDAKTEAQMIDDLVRAYLRFVTSADKMDEQQLGAKMEQLGLWRDLTNKKPDDPEHFVLRSKTLDDTDQPQSKRSGDEDSFDTEDTTAEKKTVLKSELKKKDSHPKGDTMLIDITLFGSSCPRGGQSILKEAYEISRNSILVGNNTARDNTKTKATQLYTMHDELPETQPTDKRVPLTDLLKHVWERNYMLHQREMELNVTAPESSARKPGCQPQSPHIGHKPVTPKIMPQIQRPCPGKPRAPMKEDPPAKKCSAVKNPTSLALLAAPLALPFSQTLPLLICSITPLLGLNSAAKLNAAKELTDGINQRLFGYPELKTKEKNIIEIVNVVKLETKDVTQ